MSSDNYIAVAKFPGRGYAVWMGFASDEESDPDDWRALRNAKWFETAKAAVAYAQGWYQREAIVEYGLNIAPAVMAELVA